MSPYRRSSITTYTLVSSIVCCGTLFGQDSPRPRTAKGANPSSRDTRDSVYGPKKAAPQQAANVARQARAPTKFNQFLPQPRRPQATWGELTPEQEAELELVLQAWEKKSAQVKTLECKFQMWNYMQALNNGGNAPTRVARGVILYAAPDKGHYQINEEAADPAADPPKFVEKDGEHWVCDGNAVYEFNQAEKKLFERRLPNELKGKAISNSPLPFVFGTTTVQMRQRYWMRVVTPPVAAGKEIWLRVEPKFAEDRANYAQATVILDDKLVLPKALSLTLPNGDLTNYRFDPPSLNQTLKEWLGWFKVPRTPAGWKRVIEDPPGNGGAPPPPDSQTLQLKPSFKRK